MAQYQRLSLMEREELSRMLAAGGEMGGQAELPPIPLTPPKGDRVLGFKLLGTDIAERLV
jgi:hypothetical protein